MRLKMEETNRISLLASAGLGMLRRLRFEPTSYRVHITRIISKGVLRQPIEKASFHRSILMQPLSAITSWLFVPSGLHSYQIAFAYAILSKQRFQILEVVSTCRVTNIILMFTNPIATSDLELDLSLEKIGSGGAVSSSSLLVAGKEARIHSTRNPADKFDFPWWFL